MDTIINVKGVMPHRREEAQKEIGEYLALFKKSFASDQMNITSITIAENFEQTINQLLPELVKDGYNYSSRHRSGKAIGKTVRTVNDSGISFNIVLDGGYIGKWEDNARPARIELIFHELFHAWLDKKRFNRIGAAGFKNDYLTIEGVCYGLALIRDEYLVDCYLDEVCQRFLIGDKNGSIGLKQLNLAREIDYRDEYLKLLADMPGVIDTVITGVKAGRKTIAEAWHDIHDYVEEVLTTFAHLAAGQEKEPDWKDIQKTITETPAHQKYLAGHTRVIYTEWLNYFSENYDEVKSLEIIGKEIREIFHACGFRFRNVADGIYISIVESTE
jgi:hypothetical protein